MTDTYPASALSVTMQPVSGLVPYARNARKHPEKQVAQIAGSISAFGFNNPVLVDAENRIIAGHGRVLAAEKLGLAEVPTIRLEHLSEADRRAFVLADNRIAENSGWDSEMLALEMADLSELGLDTALTGFTDAEINKLLSAGIEADPREEETPELEEQAISRPGDLWQLGDHRVLCGDATSPEEVGRLLGGEVPVLMVTDPPYGVEYRPEWRNEARGQASKRIGKVRNDDRADWREAWALFPGNIAYVWHAALFAPIVAESLEISGFALRAQIIWAKDRMVLSRGDYHWHHEPCWYAVRKTGKGRWLGDRKQTTLWQVANRAQDADTIHGTQKPVEPLPRVGHDRHCCREHGAVRIRAGDRSPLCRRHRSPLANVCECIGDA